MGELMLLTGEVNIRGPQITGWNFPASLYQSGQFVFGDKKLAISLLTIHRVNI